MAGLQYQVGDNYLGLSTAEKADVDAAVVAIREAFADAGVKKGNIRKILNEVVRGQEEE